MKHTTSSMLFAGRLESRLACEESQGTEIPSRGPTKRLVVVSLSTSSDIAVNVYNYKYSRCFVF